MWTMCGMPLIGALRDSNPCYSLERFAIGCSLAHPRGLRGSRARVTGGQFGVSSPARCFCWVQAAGSQYLCLWRLKERLPGRRYLGLLLV